MQTNYKTLIFKLGLLLLAFTIQTSFGQTNTQLGGQAGCARSSFTAGTFSPTTGTTDVPLNSYSPGTYFSMPVLQGGYYTVSTCGAPFDTQINCFAGSTTTGPFAYDDDNGPSCAGTAASVDMVPNFTDYVAVDVKQYACMAGGSSSITVYIRQNNNITFTSSNTAMCSGQTRALTATPAPVAITPQPGYGNIGSFSGVGVSGTTFTAPSVSTPTNYTITYTFGYVSQTQVITVNPLPTVTASATPANVCTGSSTTLVGAGASSYVWTGLDNPTNGVSFVPSASATYTVTGTDGNGCVNTATQAINVVSLPIASAVSQTNVSCNAGSNGAATVSASGGTPSYTYSWAPSGGTGSSATGLAAGSYTATVTDANSCTATQTFLITQPTNPLATSIVSQTGVSCNGGSNGTASISVTGGTTSYSYNWTPGNPTGDGTANVTGLTTGTWTCTVTDANGCTTTQTVNISQPTAIASSVASQTNVSCFGVNSGAASVTFSGGTPTYSYNWTPGNPTGDGTASVTGLTAGTWSCTVTDANGCVKTQTVTITQPTAIISTVTSQTNVSCNGGSNGAASVSASGGTSPYTYSWAPSGGTASTATGLAAGVYTCAITDNNSCVKNQTITISQPTAIASSVSALTNVTCNGGTNGAASVSASGGTSPYTYSWAPSGGTAATATGLAAGVYTCTITDNNSCTKTQTVSISQPTSINATVSSSTNVSCNGGSNGTATASVSGGTPTYTYAWSNGANTSTATGLPAGTISYTVTDANGCTASQSTVITQPTSIVASVSSQTNVSCNGGSNGTATASVSGGTPAYTYAWSNGATTSTATGLPAGTISYTVTDANGCTATQSATITQPTLLAASAFVNSNYNGADISCNGANDGSAGINVTGGTAPYSYQWSNGGTTATINNLFGGVYTCTVTCSNGCTVISSVTLNNPPVLSPSSVAPAIVCNGGNTSVTVSATGGISAYTGVGSFTETVGTYTYTVTDANGCSNTTSITITEPAAITGSQTLTLCAGQSVTVGTNTYNTTGVYTDVLVSANGCDSTLTTNLIVNAAISSTQNVSLCSGQSITVGGNTYSTSGTYTDVLTASNGCDSTVTTNLVVAAQIQFTQNVTLCAGQSITVGSNTYSTSGTYTDVLTASAGCDSVVTTNLTINLPISSTQTITLCSGQSLTVGSNTYNTSGIYTDVLTAVNGCDSTVTTDLTISPAITSTQTITLCAGQSITVGTNTYTATGVYTDVLTAIGGCDSTVTTNLTVNNPVDVTTTTSAETITANASGATFQWIDCGNGNAPLAGETNSSYTATTNGSYAVIVTIGSCSDTSVCTTISSVGLTKVASTNEIKLYPNPSKGLFIVELTHNAEVIITNALGSEISRATLNKGANTIDLHNESNGVYFVKVLTEGKLQTLKMVKQD